MSRENSSIAVIYKSKYGSTKRYAGWIAIKLDADLYEVSDVIPKNLDKYETIIYGGHLCAGKIKGIDLIKKNYERLKGKKLIVFAVGLAPDIEKTKKQILENNFKEDMRVSINLFYFRGAFNYNELSLVDKAMMNLLKVSLKNKKEEELDCDTKVILDALENPVDFSNKKSVTPIVDFACKNF